MKRRDFIKKSFMTVALLSSAKVMASEFGEKKEGSEKKVSPNLKSKVKKIDFYTHFSFVRFIDLLEELSGVRPYPQRKLFMNTPTMINVDSRLQHMDKYGIEMHVLAPSPHLEGFPTILADPKLAAQAARLCNDELAKVVARYPDRFFGVAVVPSTNPEIMMAEFERAIKELGLVGTMITVGPKLKRPDHQDYEPLYRKSAELDVPIWIHPWRPPTYPDYIDETESKYQVWQGLGWVLDSSTAMVRLVFNGVFERYPNLKLIIHHNGALIPLFAKRMEAGYDLYEKIGGVIYDTPISKPYLNHFKNFYCDTVIQGFEPLLLQIAYNFFGADHVLFGTDVPFDCKAGEILTPETVRSVEALSIPEEDRRKIYSGNALKLLKRA